MQHIRLAFRAAALSISVCILASSVWAEQVIKNLKDGVDVELQTSIDGKTAVLGQPFEAELKDDLRYENWRIPVGTDFRGQITKVQESRHFSRPGYVILEVQEAVLPNGQTFAFTPDKYEPRDKELRSPDSRVLGQGVLEQIPYTAAGLAVSVPLRRSGAVNNFSTVPIGLGVRMLTGAVVGLVHPRYRNERVPARIAKGALDGSGIPKIVGFVGKYPEPEFQAGDIVPLHFNPDGLRDLFHQGGVTVNGQNSPPAALVNQTETSFPAPVAPNRRD